MFRVSIMFYRLSYRSAVAADLCGPDRPLESCSRGSTFNGGCRSRICYDREDLIAFYASTPLDFCPLSRMVFDSSLTLLCPLLGGSRSWIRIRLFDWSFL